MTKVYAAAQGGPGNKIFSTLLQEFLEFAPEQAEKYSAWVLTRNSQDSANIVSSNANKLIGTWSRGSSAGSAGNLVVSRTESWIFFDDLTFENKNESYEGYSSPGMGGYSLPKSSSVKGFWAPNDVPFSPFSLVTIDESGFVSKRSAAFTDPEQSKPGGIDLNGVHFGRMW